AQGGLDQASEDRARELLCRLLTPEQRTCFYVNGFFDVVKGDTKYRLNLSNLQIHVMHMDGEPSENWCAYVPNAPRHHTLIAQLLMLRDDPEKLRKLAKVTSLRYSPWADPRVMRDSLLRQADRARRVLRSAGYIDPGILGVPLIRQGDPDLARAEARDPVIR